MKRKADSLLPARRKPAGKRGRSPAILSLAVLLACVIPTTAGADGDFLARETGESWRLMSYNPYWDAIFPSGIRRYNRSQEFRRVLAAVDPDVVCLQEIDPNRRPAEIERIFNRAIPLEGDGTWFVAKGADNVVVSRFPIVWSFGEVVQGTGVYARGHVLALIDLPGGNDAGDVLVVGTHFTSGGATDDIAARTEHADQLVQAIRLARASSAVPDDLPVVIAGDLNAYATDPRRHLDTLILGDVADEPDFGPDGSLDPGGNPLTDLRPTHNGTGAETWTWRDDTQQFEPYELDRVLYTGSSLTVIRSLVLNTSAMGADELSRHGLEAADVALNLARGSFDHLPLVADFLLD